MVDSIENLRNFNLYPIDKDVRSKHTLVEYIWIDGTGSSMRGKTKVYNKIVTTLEELEWWTYDGSSCEQATTIDSEIYLKPIAMINDPFRGAPNLIALCETYKQDQITPARYNFRWLASQIMTEVKEHVPWFGIEQEYFFMKRTGTNHNWPLGWPDGGYPSPQGKYYCAIGESNSFGRAIAEAHIRLCLGAGLKLAGLNSETAAGQWEYQVGITVGIECGDQLWFARYIMGRLGEQFGVDISYEPKPVKGDWNGSGGHVNYSTVETRSDGGYDLIRSKYLPALEKTHSQALKLYGSHNDARLTGRHETGSYKNFTWGDGHRGGSVRIPIVTKQENAGYLEDRRPAANIDPYLVTSALVDITLLNNKYLVQLQSILEGADTNSNSTMMN